MYYNDATKNAISHVFHILQRIKAQPCIQMLPLPPMLPKSQNENFQPPETTSIPEPAPGVEPVLQHPNMQTKKSLPTTSTIKQSSTSPILCPIPLFKNIQNIRRYPRLSKPEKHKHYPASSIPFTPFPAPI